MSMQTTLPKRHHLCNTMMIEALMRVRVLLKLHSHSLTCTLKMIKIILESSSALPLLKCRAWRSTLCSILKISNLHLARVGSTRWEAQETSRHRSAKTRCMWSATNSKDWVSLTAWIRRRVTTMMAHRSRPHLSRTPGLLSYVTRQLRSLDPTTAQSWADSHTLPKCFLPWLVAKASQSRAKSSFKS